MSELKELGYGLPQDFNVELRSTESGLRNYCSLDGSPCTSNDGCFLQGYIPQSEARLQEQRFH